MEILQPKRNTKAGAKIAAAVTGKTITGNFERVISYYRAKGQIILATVATERGIEDFIFSSKYPTVADCMAVADRKVILPEQK